MSIFAYQVSGFAYQGDGLFAYQGLVDSQVQPDQGTFNIRPRRRRRVKKHEIEEESLVIASEVIEAVDIVEAAPPRVVVTLESVLKGQRFDFDEESDDDMLVLTVARLIQ